MKHCFLAMVLCFCMITLHAQSPARPYAIAGKLLFYDYQLMNSKELTDRENITNGFEIGIMRSINKHFNAVVPMKVGVARFLHETTNTNIYSIDGLIQLNPLSNSKAINPYLFGGVGGCSFDGKELDIQIPVGIGLNFRFFEGFYLNLQAESRFSFSKDRSNLQYGVGLVYEIGAKKEKPKEMPPPQLISNDSDGDGVTDDKDACPKEAGSIAALGCPDKDSDGIADKDDLCPDDAGPIATMGCPDKDGDGVLDKDDQCPNEAGPANLKGCPSVDADNDGIPDSEDECPFKAGTKATKGCPDKDRDGVADRDDDCPDVAGVAKVHGCPDTDNDGIKDSEDHCPTSAGPAENQGCPVVMKEDKETLDVAKRAVQFETGMATLKKESYPVLDQLAKILAKYPDYRLSIEGHTDNVGSDAANLKLSEERTRACYDYLLFRGIQPERITYKGFGESNPVSDNKTEQGRYLNRRVEFNLILK